MKIIDLKIKKGTEMVYFIQVGVDGPVKIGFSADIYKRAVHIQVHNPYQCFIVGLIEGKRSLESNLLKSFADYMMFCGWYWYGDRLATFLAKLDFLPIEITRTGRALASNSSFKGAGASLVAKRARIRRRVLARPCDNCSAPSCDIKPKKSWDSNDPADYSVFCRRCSMECDGRMKHFKEVAMRPRQPKEPQACIVCGKPEKYRRRGRCHSCNEYFRRHSEDKRHGNTS